MKVYSQPIPNTDTCSISKNDKRIWSVVWQVNKQQKIELLNKDTIIMYDSLLIKSMSIRLDNKDTVINQFKAIGIKAISATDKERKRKVFWRNTALVELGLLTITTAIIITPILIK